MDCIRATSSGPLSHAEKPDAILVHFVRNPQAAAHFPFSSAAPIGSLAALARRPNVRLSAATIATPFVLKYANGHDALDAAVIGAAPPPPPKDNKPKPAMWSRKVFVGGLPAHVQDDELYRVFGAANRFTINRPNQSGAIRSKSYCFLIFENAERGRYVDGGFFADVWAGNRVVKVQIRPFNVYDAKYVADAERAVNLRLTVFVGGISRTSRAVDLVAAFSTFGEVAGVTIDLDPELLYPRGTARVFFASIAGYTRAMRQKVVHVRAAEEAKCYELKPFIFDNLCENCFSRSIAKHFCGAPSCLSYYCDSCWNQVHAKNTTRAHHRPFNKGALGQGSPSNSQQHAKHSPSPPAFLPTVPPKFAVGWMAQMHRPPPTKFSL
ncbi:CBR-CPB-1 protein [Aphelenchoides fujianensis]|nr:CBR-CPB-1 protein [Aphelenchoides fujianensis]